MRQIVKVPGRHNRIIRPLFANTGLAGYFFIAAEIPQEFFDQEITRENYSLFISDERVSQDYLDRGQVILPSIAQVLWAVGFAGVELMGIISEKPVQFIHPPFRIPCNNSEDDNVWRQIQVSRAERKDRGFIVGTVCAHEESAGSLFAYLMPHG